jgi:uncharacterized protein (TIGR03435 family)
MLSGNKLVHTFALAFACAALHGQTAAPKFEAASVKPSSVRGGSYTGIVGGPGTSNPGQIAYNDQTLKNLVFIAYRVQFYQLNTPSWMEGESFDIVAKVPAGATKEDVPLMLQDLAIQAKNSSRV